MSLRSPEKGLQLGKLDRARIVCVRFLKRMLQVGGGHAWPDDLHPPTPVGLADVAIAVLIELEKKVSHAHRILLDLLPQLLAD